MFTSALRPKEVIINDSNHTRYAPTEDATVDGQYKRRGRVPRNWQDEPYCSHPHAKPIDFPLIPESEWAARIEEMERTKTRLSDICDQAGLKSLDQNGTNYCWCNAVITALTIIRARDNMPFVDLSPASVAAQVKGYRNAGGWGGEALEFIVQNGVATQKDWPPNAISRQYLTDAMKKDALTRRVTEWYDLEERNFQQLMTLLLLRIPVAIGLNWWSHEVCAVDPVVISAGQFGVRFRNSWGDSYGDHGFNILTRSRSTPDDACAPRVIMATAESNKGALATAL